MVDTKGTVAVVEKKAEEVKILTPKELAARMGISPKRLRAMLRADRPRGIEDKGKKWELPLDIAKAVEKDYKEKKAKAEAEKKAEVQKELKGEK